MTILRKFCLLQIVLVSVIADQGDLIDLCLDKLTEGNSAVPKCKNNFYNTTLSDPRNCSNFFYCRDASLYPAKCPAGTNYDDNFNKCLTESVNCKAPCLSNIFEIYIVTPSTSMSSSTKKSPLSTQPLSTKILTTPSTLKKQTTPTIISTSLKAFSTSTILTTSVNLTTPNSIASTFNLYTTSSMLIPSTTEVTNTTILTTTAIDDPSLKTQFIIPTIDNTYTFTSITSILASISFSKPTDPVVHTKNDTTLGDATLSSFSVVSMASTDALTYLISNQSTLNLYSINVTTIASTIDYITRNLSSTYPSSIENITNNAHLDSTSNINVSSTKLIDNIVTKVSDGITVDTFSDANTSLKVITLFQNSSLKLAETTASAYVDNYTTPRYDILKTDFSFDSTSLEYNYTTLSSISGDINGSFTMTNHAISTSRSEISVCHLGESCQSGEVIGDPDNCSRYYVCLLQSVKNRWFRKSCAINMSFDAGKRDCISSELNFNCTEKCFDKFEHVITMEPNVPKVGDRLIFRSKSRVKISYSYVQIEKFIWRLNGKDISPRSNAISIVDEGPEVDGYQYSTLTFENALREYSGEIENTIWYGKIYMHNSSLQFQIATNPVISISSKYTGIQAGDLVSIYCVLDLNQVIIGGSTEFHWFVNNVRITDQEKGFRIWSNSTFSLIEFIANMNIHLSCVTFNQNGQSEPANSSIYILNSNPSLICDEKGSYWPPANIGQTIFIPCYIRNPNNEGLLQRTCMLAKNMAQWSQENTEDCYLNDLDNYGQKVDNLMNGIGIYNGQDIDSVASDLLSVISRENLSTKEINLVFNNSLKLLHVVNQLERINYDFMNFCNLTNELLGIQFYPLWRNNTKRVTDIMLLVENVTMNFAKTLRPGDSKSFRMHNIVVEVSSQNVTQNVQSISFPTFIEEYSDDLFVSAATLKNGVEKDIIFVSSILFMNLQEFFIKNNTNFINSHVMSLSIDGLESKKLSPKIILNLQQNNKTLVGYSPNCTYWNIKKESWEMDGCKVNYSNSSLVVCECEHLTNFAILMSLSPAHESDAYILSIISTVGCAISIGALFLTILIYVYRWKIIRSHQAVVIINLCIALIISYIIFLAGADKTYYPNVCLAVAIMLHYFFLVVFCLMLVEGIELLICIMFVFHNKRIRETVVLLLIAWIIPMVIVSLTLAVTRLQGYSGLKSCWLQLDNGVIWAFVGPALFIIAVNMVISIIILVRICGMKRAPEKDNLGYKIRATLWNILVITPVVGLAWIFGVLSTNENLVAFQYLFTIFNSLQGLLIFLFHGLYNKQPSTHKKTSTYGRSPKNEITHRRTSFDDITYMISNGSDNAYQLTNGVVNPGYMGSSSGYSNSTGTTILPNIDEEDNDHARDEVNHTLSSSTVNSEGSDVSGFYYLHNADALF